MTTFSQISAKKTWYVQLECILLIEMMGKTQNQTKSVTDNLFAPGEIITFRLYLVDTVKI